MRHYVLLALIVALSSCGARTGLTPPENAQLPPAPFGESEPRTADELLKQDVQAIPERSVELRKRSEIRADDPFDLPPKD
jgi:hypothetical protein